MSGIKPLDRALLYVLSSLSICSAFVYASKNGIVDPYLHGIISSVILYQTAVNIPLASTQFSNVPGLGFLLLTLSNVSSVDPETLEYVPLAGFLFVLSSFVLARRLTHSGLFGLAAATAIGFRWLPQTLSTVWPHTFGFALFLLFVSLFLKAGSRRSPALIATMWVLFLGMHMYSYTAEAWVITFVGGATLLGVWRREKSRTVTSSLFLALLVTALGFTQIVYTGYIPGVQTAAADFGFGFQTLLSSILRTSPPVAYAWIPPATPYAILAVQLTWYLAISLPLIAVIYLRRNSRAMLGAPWRLIPLSTPILALALVWPVDAFAYASLGALAIGLFRFSTLGGLLLTVPATRELTQKGIPAFLRNRGAILPHSLAVLVVMLSAILLASASAQNIAISSQVLYADAKPAGLWLLEHQPGITFIYGDHNTQGQFAIDAARIGENFVSSNLFTETSYAAILGRPAQNVSFLTGEYVAVNLQLARFKTSAGGWVDFEALSGHLTEIKSNPELALIYDDGNVWILTGLADDTYPPQP